MAGGAGMLLSRLGLALALAAAAAASRDAKRLHDDLLSDYNRLIRPVGNHSHKVTIVVGLKLSQLIDIVSGDPSSVCESDLCCVPLGCSVAVDVLVLCLRSG